MRSIAAVVFAVLVGLGFMRALAYDRAQAEARNHIELDGVRGEVAKAAAENLGPTILKEAPMLWSAAIADMPHPAGNSVRLIVDREPADTGYWAYDGKSKKVFIDCTHTDSNGKVWASY